MTDTISAHVRGSTFLPSIPLFPLVAVSWYPAWDSRFVVTFLGAYIERLLRRSVLCSSCSNPPPPRRSSFQVTGRRHAGGSQHRYHAETRVPPSLLRRYRAYPPNVWVWNRFLGPRSEDGLEDEQCLQDFRLRRKCHLVPIGGRH